MPAHLIAQASINGNSNGVISPRKRLKLEYRKARREVSNLDPENRIEVERVRGIISCAVYWLEDAGMGGKAGELKTRWKEKCPKILLIHKSFYNRSTV